MFSIMNMSSTMKAIDEVVEGLKENLVGNIDRYKVSGTYDMNRITGTCFGEITIDENGYMVGRIIDSDRVDVHKIMEGDILTINDTTIMEFMKCVPNKFYFPVYHHLEKITNGDYSGTYRGNWFLNRKRRNNNGNKKHKQHEKSRKIQLDEISMETPYVEINKSSLTLTKIGKTRTSQNL